MGDPRLRPRSEMYVRTPRKKRPIVEAAASWLRRVLIEIGKVLDAA